MTQETPGELLQGLQVLVVEDCPDQIRMFAQLLMAQGAIVSSVTSGPAALQSFKQKDGAYDAVVMDFQLGDLDGDAEDYDGIRVTHELRELGFRGRIIGVTARGNDTLRERWLKEGCDVYFEKPFNHHLLPQALLGQSDGESTN